MQGVVTGEMCRRPLTPAAGPIGRAAADHHMSADPHERRAAFGMS